LFPRDLIVSRGEFHHEAQPRDEIETRLTMIPREQKAAPVGRILLLVTTWKREFGRFISYVGTKKSKQIRIRSNQIITSNFANSKICQISSRPPQNRL
jgi:hypothetical protein